jgi:hypothetical protein
MRGRWSVSDPNRPNVCLSIRTGLMGLDPSKTRPPNKASGVLACYTGLGWEKTQ